MHVYQFSLKGWDGGSDGQDHLVKWVKAPSRDVVKRFCEANGLELEYPDEPGREMEPECIDEGMPGYKDDEDDEDQADIDSGVDCVLDWNGNVIMGNIGGTKPC